MEPLPRGANFQRALMLWEIGLHIAGNPNTPYYGPRDMCIAVGSGSSETFKPWLRMSTGSPILAHAVCKNELEAAMINPSGLLTQAYRGTGLFPQPLPVRFDAALASGVKPATLDDHAFKYLVDQLGWRKYTIKPGRFKNLTEDYTCIDYSGWPIYTRAALPDDDAYKICDAINARKEQMFWEDSYTGIGQLGENTDATPRD